MRMVPTPSWTNGSEGNTNSTFVPCSGTGSTTGIRCRSSWSSSVASESATTKHTLGVNHRSDGPLVRSLGVLLGGAQLGDPQIVVHPVSADHEDSRLGIADGTAPDGLLAPVRLRALPSQRVLPPGERSVSIGTVRPLVAADCAAEVTRLLTGRTTFDGRPLRAGDIAVLAHTRRQLDEVRSALTALGLRSVIVSSDSI